MTLEGFSNGFDTLLNSYSKVGAFGDTMPDIRLDEYEKSLFLTKAQEELVISLYNGRNSSALSFEETEELRRYLSNLIVEAELKPITTSDGKPLGLESSSTFFTLPNGKAEEEDKENEEVTETQEENTENTEVEPTVVEESVAEVQPAVWFITYESVIVSDGKCGKDSSMSVIPARQDEYHKLKKNPFRGANDRRALRFDLGDDNVEIVCKYTVAKYYIRYITKPSPIVLIDLEDGLDVGGNTKATPCVLHEALHQRILERAVLLALQSKGININNENR